MDGDLGLLSQQPVFASHGRHSTPSGLKQQQLTLQSGPLMSKIKEPSEGGCKGDSTPCLLQLLVAAGSRGHIPPASAFMGPSLRVSSSVSYRDPCLQIEGPPGTISSSLILSADFFSQIRSRSEVLGVRICTYLFGGRSTPYASLSDRRCGCPRGTAARRLGPWSRISQLVCRRAGVTPEQCVCFIPALYHLPSGPVGPCEEDGFAWSRQRWKSSVRPSPRQQTCLHPSPCTWVGCR